MNVQRSNTTTFLTCQTCKKKLWVEEFTWRIRGTVRNYSCRICMLQKKSTLNNTSTSSSNNNNDTKTSTIVKTCTKCFKKIPVSIASSQPLQYPPEAYDSLLNVFVCLKCTNPSSSSLNNFQNDDDDLKKERDNNNVEQPKKRQKKRNNNNYNGMVYDLETFRKLPSASFCSNQYETFQILNTEKKLNGKTCTHCWEFKTYSAFPDDFSLLDKKGPVCTLCSQSLSSSSLLLS